MGRVPVAEFLGISGPSRSLVGRACLGCFQGVFLETLGVTSKDRMLPKFLFAFFLFF